MRSKNCVIGIYAWSVNGIIRYVGHARDIFNSRKSNHLTRFRQGTHIPKLQQLWDERDADSFKLVVLEECLVRDLLEREKYYKDLHKDTVFNINDIRNTNKKFKTGLKAKQHKETFSELFSGVNNPNCDTELDTVIQIKIAIRDGMKNKDICEMFGKNSAYISRIRTGARWGNISIPDNYKKMELPLFAVEIVPENENILYEDIITQNELIETIA